LIRAFAAYDQIPEQDVIGTASGSVYYAYDPSTSTYWALAKMDPRLTAPVSVLVKFQDGANRVIFAERSGSSWSVVNLVGEPPCLAQQGLPAAIESLWGLTDAPECRAAVDTGIGVYGDCKAPSVEPTEIVVTCADDGWVLKDLHWSSWTASEATTVGSLVYNDCHPYCAAGHFHTVPGTHVTLTAPVRGAGGQLVWSHLMQSPELPGYATGPYHGGPFPLPTGPI
jgi:hypothetical protein